MYPRKPLERAAEQTRQRRSREQETAEVGREGERGHVPGTGIDTGITMYQPPIVNFPVFSVTWSKSTGSDGASTAAVLTAGGGGAGNTGVGNKIVRE